MDITSIYAAESGATVLMKAVKAVGGIGTSRQVTQAEINSRIRKTKGQRFLYD